MKEYLPTWEIMHRQNPQGKKHLIEDRIKKAKAQMEYLEMQALKAMAC